MTSTLAIVDSVEEITLAARAGFDRIALEVGRGLGPQTLPTALPGDVATGLMIALPDALGVGAPELARLALAAGCRVIWLPLHARGHDFLRASVAAGLHTIGLIVPEHPPDEALCRDAAGLGLTSLLVASASRQGRLLDTLAVPALDKIVALCRGHLLAIGLAGGLEAADVPRLLAIGPDELGFDRVLRDAAGKFDAVAARSIVKLARPPVAPFRAAGARAPSADRIFVRNWTIEMSIGVYARERGISQRVRFNVEVDVLPAPDRSPGLAGIVSYDLITDAIARLAADHIDLVEDMAERLATLVLFDPRVGSVDITIEKLDVGPGSVGCRVVRDRSSPA